MGLYTPWQNSKPVFPGTRNGHRWWTPGDDDEKKLTYVGIVIYMFQVLRTHQTNTIAYLYKYIVNYSVYAN